MKEYVDRADRPLRDECEPPPVEVPIVVAGSMPWSGGAVAVSIETLPAEIEAPEDEDDEQEEELEEDVWRPYRNRAARRRFVKQWGQQTSSRRTRGRSLGRRPKKRTLKVVEFLARES